MHWYFKNSPVKMKRFQEELLEEKKVKYNMSAIGLQSKQGLSWPRQSRQGWLIYFQIPIPVAV